jgi:methylated-DNA-[protein]-cysteine S-methyltransferase
MSASAICIANVSTARLGTVWTAASNRGLTTVEFGVGRAAFESTIQHQLRRSLAGGTPRARQIAESAACQIEEYLLAKRRALEIPIDWGILSSDFQRLALKAVMAIPYGAVRTYGQLAVQIGYPRAPRAVGRANATNPMPLVIPCHRVVGSDGKLHGYGGYGGLQTKQWLLDFEHESVTVA